MVLYYIHDPMCSWCYGFGRVLSQLKQNLPDELEMLRLLGGLAPDTDQPMSESMQADIRSNWQRIEQTIPGVHFNYAFWDTCSPRRATYPACRAVIAARDQGEAFDEVMTSAIQRAYYQQARNPSDDSTLIALADEIGLDVDRFTVALNSSQTQDRLQREIMQASGMGVASYPSLCLQTADELHTIRVDYNQVSPMLESIRMLAYG